jgi:hypothetical protein
MRKYYLLTFVLLLLFTGCQESETAPVDENYVTLEDALKFAAVQAPLTDPVNDIGEPRKVKAHLVVQPDSNLPSMYIINYDGGGFIILAADQRIDPILAYSENNPFDIDTKILPEGLVNWLEAVHNTVQQIRTDNPKQDNILNRVWDNGYKKLHPITGNTRHKANTKTQETWYEGDCNNGDSGYQQITHVNPLVVTNWDQGSGYNDNCPQLGCTEYSNGRAPSGCVATSTGQIMRFFQFPASFNWAQMPAGDSPTGEVARLLADIGSKVLMSYGCDGSGANYHNVKGTLAGYGYPMPSDGNYNYWTASDCIQGHRPVLLGGSRSTAWWIFGTKNGHLWVADGMDEIMYYSCSPDPNTPGEWVAVYYNYTAGLHMNWGWGGTNDAWYASNNFNPGDRTYNVDQHQVINIRRP